MTIEQLHDTINNTPPNAVKLYFILRNKGKSSIESVNKYSFKVYHVDCDEELRSRFRESSLEQLKRLIDANCEVTDYDVFSDDSEELLKYELKTRKEIAFSDVVKKQLPSINIEKIIDLSSALEEKDKWWAYCIEFLSPTTSQRIFSFRKIKPSNVCTDEKKTNILRALFSTKSRSLSLIKEETINLDHQIDCLFYEDTFYVLKKTNFEQIVGVQEEYKEEAKKILSEILNNEHIHSDNSQEIISLIENKPSIHRKLIKASKLANYRTLTSKDISRMSEICAKYNDILPVEDGKLVIKDIKGLDVVLKALADYYKIGEFSSKSYGTFAGKELTHHQNSRSQDKITASNHQDRS